MYEHPGKAFLTRYTQVNSPDDVFRYAAYLREEARLKPGAPADLGKIYQRFGIPTPKRASLPNQQGLLLMPDIGLIIINEEDIDTRQRFTEAHELMELLFDALPEKQVWSGFQKGPFKHHVKENLCDQGAAALLMPPEAFQHYADTEGVSFTTAKKLAQRFGVSQTAALIQLVRTSIKMHAVVLWRLKHKKSDLKHHPGQLPLFGSPADWQPEKKLRVEWSMGSPRMPGIPKNKSVPEDSVIYTAFSAIKFTSGQEELDLGTFSGQIFSENWAFKSQSGPQVLSLLSLVSKYNH